MSTRAEIYYGNKTYAVASDGYPSCVIEYLQGIIKAAKRYAKKHNHTIKQAIGIKLANEADNDDGYGFIYKGHMDSGEYIYKIENNKILWRKAGDKHWQDEDDLEED